MISILKALITMLLAFIGFYAIYILLIFTVGDSERISLYACTIVIGGLLIVIINLLSQINDKLQKNQDEYKRG